MTLPTDSPEEAAAPRPFSATDFRIERPTWPRREAGDHDAPDWIRDLCRKAISRASR